MQSRLRGCALSLPGVTEKVILNRICFQVHGATRAAAPLGIADGVDRGAAESG